MDLRPIGVFDSGVGGLTVVKEILSQLPDEEIIYFGDTKRAPYGNLDKSTLSLYAKQTIGFLRGHDVKALVVACNTSYASCREELLSLPIPVIGVIEPGVSSALDTAPKSVAVLATSATIRSGLYKKLLLAENNSLIYYEKICPDFVPLVEAGLMDSPMAYATAKERLKEFEDKKPDSVILGCTHFPLMQKAIEAAFGEGVRFIDPAVATAGKLAEYLEAHDMCRVSAHKPLHRFFVSGQEETCNFFLRPLLEGSASATCVAQTVQIG